MNEREKEKEIEIEREKEREKYKIKDTISQQSIKNTVWGIMGLLLGVSINNFIILISNFFRINNLLLQNIIQITSCAVIIATIQHYYNYFGWSWQNVTPGIFFVGFFFGTQFKLLNNLSKSVIIKDRTVRF